MTASFGGVWQSLCTHTEELMQAKQVPGVALGLSFQDQQATVGLGVTSSDNPLPVTDETLFQIGSITKTFTALLLLQLVEQGQVDLDAPVRTYLPTFAVADQEVSRQVTVRHLLTHRAGWAGDLFLDTGSGQDALARYVAEMATLPQVAALGAVHSYNNAGFCAAGRVVEVLSGKPFDQALQEGILDPLGLSCTLDPLALMTRRFAVGHELKEGKLGVAQPWALPRSLWSAGGICSHVHDLLTYGCSQLGDGAMPVGKRLLSAESMAAWHRQQAVVNAPDERMALAWFLGRAGDVDRLYHGGSTVGQTAYLMAVPERQLVLAILTNAAHGSAVIHAVAQEVLQELLRVPKPVCPPYAAAAEELPPLVGHYGRPAASVDLGLLGGRLVAVIANHIGFPTQHVPPAPPSAPMSLRLCARDRLQVLDGDSQGAKWDILRHPDGSVGWLRIGGRVHRRDAQFS